MENLALITDLPEWRIKRDRLALLVPGKPANDKDVGWDLENSSNVWIDPITRTVMLRPYPTTEEWGSNFTGNYARLPMAAWQKDTGGPLDATVWSDHNVEGDGEGRLYGIAGGDPYDVIKTTGSWPRNQPFWFSWQVAAAGSQDFLQVAVQMGDLVIGFTTHGHFYVARYSTVGILGEGTVIFKEPENVTTGPKDTGQGASGRHLGGEYVDLLLIPCRRRELLIVSLSTGGGHSVALDDVDTSVAEPVITSGGPLQVKFWSGQPNFAAAPVRFYADGYVLSPSQQLFIPPDTGETATAGLYSDLPGYPCGATISASVTDTDGTTPFVGDGVKADAVVRVDMASDGTGTPFLYDAKAVFAAQAVLTPDENQNLMGIGSNPRCLIEASLSVPECPGAASWRLRFQDADTLLAAVPLADHINNRPFSAAFGTLEWFRGSSFNPRPNAGASALSRLLEWEVFDRWEALRRYRMRRPLPWDGMRLDDVVTELATMPGFPTSDLDIEPMSLLLGATDAPSKGEFAQIAETLDTPADWLEQLFRTYCGNFIAGWMPKPGGGVRFRWRDPDTLGTTADATIYPDHGSAEFAFGPSVLVDAGVTTSIWQKDFGPEANEVAVGGYNARLNRVYRSFAEDRPSKDPTVAPSAKTALNVGAEYIWSLFDPALNSQAIVNTVGARAWARLFRPHIIAEISAPLILCGDGRPLWVGDVVAVTGWGRYRVLSFDCDFLRERTTIIDRRAVYVGERVGDV